MSTPIIGSCLCGAVSLKVPSLSPKVVSCHCDTCRKWNGGPLFAVDCGSAVEIAGETSVARFATSAWAERAFCATCGTHLFCLIRDSDKYLVPPGLFDGVDNFAMALQIFIDKKPTFYTFAENTATMTGADFLAATSAS